MRGVRPIFIFKAEVVFTSFLLLLLAGVTAAVFWKGDDGLINVVVQAVVLLTQAALVFWFGKAKAEADALSANPPPPVGGDDCRYPKG